MTSTDSTPPPQPEETVTVTGVPRTTEYTQTDLIVAQVRARRLGAASNLVLGIIVLAALVFAGYVVKGSGDRADSADQQAKTNGDLISDRMSFLGVEEDERRLGTEIPEEEVEQSLRSDLDF